MILQPSPGTACATQAQNSISVSGRLARVVMKGLVCMNMISPFRLCSGRREIVPGGTETVGGEDETEAGEAPIERRAAAEALGGQLRHRAPGKRAAQPTISLGQSG